VTNFQHCTCGVDHRPHPCPVLARAIEKLGAGARIGRNCQFPDAELFVGKYDRGDWKMFGAGSTWDEAFANVKKVKFHKGNGQFEFEEEKKEKS
jgi:hypothetical protein